MNPIEKIRRGNSRYEFIIRRSWIEENFPEAMHHIKWSHDENRFVIPRLIRNESGSIQTVNDPIKISVNSLTFDFYEDINEEHECSESSTGIIDDIDLELNNRTEYVGIFYIPHGCNEFKRVTGRRNVTVIEDNE